MKESCRQYLLGIFGDPAVVHGLYSQYVEAASGQIDEIADLLERGDFAAVDRLAHTIKGNALSVGDEGSALAAAELCAAAKKGDASGCREFAARLARERPEM